MISMKTKMPTSAGFSREIRGTSVDAVEIETSVGDDMLTEEIETETFGEISTLSPRGGVVIGERRWVNDEIDPVFSRGWIAVIKGVGEWA